MMDSPVISEERAATMLGVPGRFFARTIGGNNYKPGTFTSQKWISERRRAPQYSDKAEMQVSVRFDDGCRNGHNTFAITADVTEPSRVKGRRIDVAGGCLHDDIAKVFPELAPLIKWHLTSSEGPMHYIANTVYLAGDRDHNGKRAGEPWAFDDAIKFGDFPIIYKVKSREFLKFLQEIATWSPDGQAGALIPVAVAHENKPGDNYKFSPKYQFAGDALRQWHECPFESEESAAQFASAFLNFKPAFIRVPTLWSEGKERELDAARRAAVWPDATDAELSAPPDELKAALEKRHSQLMADFRSDMESAGFVWQPDSQD